MIVKDALYDTKTSCFTLRGMLCIRMAGRQQNLQMTVPELAGTVL